MLLNSLNALEKLEAHAKDADYLFFITVAPDNINSFSAFFITF